MRYEIELSPEAVEDFGKLEARWRSMIRDEMETHLRFEPAKESKSRIKRLRELIRPEYRLRVGDYRVFYNIRNDVVEILAIISKKNAAAWLEAAGAKK